MVLRSKRDYLEAVSSRYQRAGRNAKTIILDEFCENCGYNRKYAIRLLRKLNKRSSGKSGKRPGPRTIYHEAKLLEALKRIWFATDQMCSKKLKVAIPLWLPFYEKESHFESASNATLDTTRQMVKLANLRFSNCNDKGIYPLQILLIGPVTRHFQTILHFSRFIL